jgi:hypothetical protein
MDLAVEEARRVLGLAYTNVAVVQEQVSEAIATPLSSDTFWEFVESQFPIGDCPTKRALTIAENSRSTMLEIWRSQTVSNVAGTKWAGIQAISEFSDWFVGSADVRSERVLLGSREGWQREAVGRLEAVMAPAFAS